MSTVLFQQLGVGHNALHPVQEPAINAGELVEALHGVASPQSSSHHKDPLICWSLQLLLGKNTDSWMQDSAGVEKNTAREIRNGKSCERCCHYCQPAKGWYGAVPKSGYFQRGELLTTSLTGFTVWSKPTQFSSTMRRAFWKASSKDRPMPMTSPGRTGWRAGRRGDTQHIHGCHLDLWKVLKAHGGGVLRCLLHH